MNKLQATQADRLKHLHAEIMGAARVVMEKAIEAGGILQEVKAALPHGDFTGWVEQNAGFNIRTAQRYMKIYENRDMLKNDSVSLLTDAHRMLTAPKEDRDISINGLSIDDVLRIAEHDDKYTNLHKRILVLKDRWEAVKDSQDLKEVVNYYHEAKALHIEAAELTLYAEVNLGRCLNEMKKLLPTKQKQDEFLSVCKSVDCRIAKGSNVSDILQDGGTVDHIELFNMYRVTGLNSQWVESIMRVL